MEALENHPPHTPWWHTLARWYQRCLEFPRFVLTLIALLCLLSCYFAQDFTHDASADTLVAQNDPELAYYREITRHFGSESFLFFTYTPRDDVLFSRQTLGRIDRLSNRLEALNGVASVTSILDAPLLKSPPVALGDLAGGFYTLRKNGVDVYAARDELMHSPLFKDLLISADGKTTALRVDLVENKELSELSARRNALRMIETPSPAESRELDRVNEAYWKLYYQHVHDLERVIHDIRRIRDSISHEARAYLGGVPMIASDMVLYVKKDILVFGVISLTLMALMLAFFFRQHRWVFLPLASASISVLLTVGLLGFLQKPVTVVSSNFIALLVILSISMIVHLVSRYRDLLEKNPFTPHIEIVQHTMGVKLAPCVYTALTTMLGFASLYTSSIVPVMDFGWIMCCGIFISFFVAYFFFPCALLTFPREVLHHTTRDNNTPLVRHSYRFAARRTWLVISLSALLAVLGSIGISRLSLDNRFIDYFKEDTEIYQGLAFIDKHLGGTTPMDVIVKFPPYEEDVLDEEDAFFVEEDLEEEDTFPQRYWFTPDKIEILRQMEAYFEARPEIGKSISLATLEKIAQNYNDGKPLDAIAIVAILSAIPEELRKEFITPYASPEEGLMRISMRLHETGPAFSRDKLIQDIEDFSTDSLQLKEGQVRVTGINVLLNGMLKELFSSQAYTLIFVIGATFFMFRVLLGSSKLAVMGLLPNILSAVLVLALMGYASIPLDMMTITIAAIVIGIGVDDAIHYLHRFKESFEGNHDTDAAVRTSHREIGRALYITSVTIVVGFSILCASNFVPILYFGVLASLAMILALLANLIILPALLLKFYRAPT